MPLKDLVEWVRGVPDSMPDEMKLMAAYSQACADLSGISSIENFALGFRMGAQLMLAILEPDNHEPEGTGERLGES